MRIGLNAHLLSGASGYRAAGIHQYIYQLLRHLPVVAPGDWDFTAMVGAGNDFHIEGIRMRHARWNTASPLGRILWEQLAQPREIGAFDLLHAMAFVAPLRTETPTVTTVYDLTFIRYPQGLSFARRAYLRAFGKRSCEQSKRIIAISESARHDLITLWGIAPEKIDVTPPGYDREIFRPLPEKEIEGFRIKKGLPERFWLYLGTLEPRKNLANFLRAYAKLSANERLPFILAGGKGWQYEEIFRTIEDYNLSDKVRYAGFLPSDEIALWYNSAEAFIYPSVYEGFGLPVLEAMACGTPVITSAVSSLPEIAGGIGLCVSPYDAEAWTEALRKALIDEDWREAARAGGLLKAREYNWQRTAQETIQSYYRTLG